MAVAADDRPTLRQVMGRLVRRSQVTPHRAGRQAPEVRGGNHFRFGAKEPAFARCLLTFFGICSAMAEGFGRLSSRVGRTRRLTMAPLRRSPDQSNRRVRAERGKGAEEQERDVEGR